MLKRQLIGFQLQSVTHDAPLIPDDLSSFEVLTFRGLELYLNQNPTILKDYKVVPIFEGDVQRPTMLG